ncbi:MAG: anhydro-N-acetylmuramic acid kinase [Bacteroidetes bacterium]|nr:MAG: anhydro-N-acetylmuramic acid kinase [Bacteroidota bacterium]
MDKKQYNVIGLMSGTSLDGLDMAYCRFEKEEGKWQFELLDSGSVGYDDYWFPTLKNAIDLSKNELLLLDNKYGKWLGEETSKFIKKNSLSVDLIASHGHTVYHQPDKGITLQIGSGQELANLTGTKVVCNFREKDVTLGGQGAPLVPIGDEQLFGQYAACLNLGGIANVSFRKNNERVAFDIGMANMLLNHLANQLDKPYDKSGLLARSGKVNQPLLEKLNKLSFYQLPSPKSLGYEWFLSDVLPLFEESEASVVDQLATAVEHETFQIGKVFTESIQERGEILVTGGGGFNDYFIERLKYYTPKQLQVIVPDKILVDFKEAIVFAFMGVLRLRNEDNCLKSVTGASQNCSGGDVFEPL